MKNFEIKNKYESKLNNISFDYIIQSLFTDNYTIDELYNEMNKMKEPISKTNIQFIYDNYQTDNKKKITIGSEIRELSKEEIFIRANELYSKYKKLIIIYLRVSTKNEGQEETDQLPDIVKTFNLDIEQCLVITAKESAYQEKKDKFRRFNYIYDIAKQFEKSSVKIYLWDLDRAYRNREKLANFFQFTKDYKVDVFSFNQKFINEIYGIKLPMGLDWLKYFIVGLFINFLGWVAEDESTRKGKRLKKSLTLKDDGHYYTNKNNMFGRKLIKKVVNKGTDKEKKIYYTADELNKIKDMVLFLRKHNKTIHQIKNIMKEKRDIEISVGFISKIINK